MITNETAVLTLTDETFAAEIEQSRGLAVVDFWAVWCGPCRMLGPIIEHLAADYAGRVKVAKVDVDACPETTARFAIRSMPTLLFFKDGRQVDSVVGAVPRPAIEARVQAHL